MKGTEHVKGLKAKAKALEDSFFAKENERILQELRAAKKREEKKKEFRKHLSIDNDEILGALVDLEVEPETLIAFSLVPLVEVAWTARSSRRSATRSSRRPSNRAWRTAARRVTSSRTGSTRNRIRDCSRCGRATSLS